MLELTTDEIVRRIEAGRTFQAEATDAGFFVRIAEWQPVVGTAIHDGHRLRPELQVKCRLSELERWQEEDPCTAAMIEALPITLIGLDSRYEYDLNRPPAEAVYDVAWGRKVWRKPLTKADRLLSLQKHKKYYQVLDALLRQLVSRFEGAVVYDLHSYNRLRWEREVPTFNLGWDLVDRERYSDVCLSLVDALDRVEWPSEVPGTVTSNDVFKGHGYQCRWVSERHPQVVDLALEVAKVYCNEEDGTLFPAVIEGIAGGLKEALSQHASAFCERFTSIPDGASSRILSKGAEPDLQKVDHAIHQCVKGFELLEYVNPINLAAERRAFFGSRFRKAPDFRYRPMAFDTRELKRRLHRIPVEKISDPDIRSLYEASVTGYVDKVDLLSDLGSSRFLYGSLRYFGAPTEKDVRNALYLMQLPPVEKEPMATLSAAEAAGAFREGLAGYGFNAKVVVSPRMVADAMVLGQQRKVMVKKGARFAPKALKRVVHHEIGVHMVTTENAALQPLKLPTFGTPVNTMTQEGLAVLSEYLSGTISLQRLRELGLRVLACDHMVRGAHFPDTFAMLVDEHGMDVEQAFFLCARAYRGGGFTKDHLYLRGFRKVLRMWRRGEDLSALLIGKCSIEWEEVLREMVERELLLPPRYFPVAFEEPLLDRNDPIYDYIVTGIR